MYYITFSVMSIFTINTIGANKLTSTLSTTVYYHCILITIFIVHVFCKMLNVFHRFVGEDGKSNGIICKILTLIFYLAVTPTYTKHHAST